MLGFSYDNVGVVTHRDWLEPRPAQYPAEVHPRDAWRINNQVTQVSSQLKNMTLLHPRQTLNTLWVTKLSSGEISTI